MKDSEYAVQWISSDKKVYRLTGKYALLKYRRMLRHRILMLTDETSYATKYPTCVRAEVYLTLGQWHLIAIREHGWKDDNKRSDA